MSFLQTLREILPNASEIIREGSAAEVDQESLRGDPNTVAEAVRSMPNTSELFPTRESYLGVGYAIKAALPDDPHMAFDLYSDWCARWQGGENKPDVVAADWGRMKAPYKRGATWLYEQAEIASEGVFSKASQWFEEPEDAPLFPENAPKPFEKGPSKKFELITLEDAAELALSSGAKPLIKGLLDQGAMTVLYGESNTGKTFVAMAMAYHIATGRSWGGLKVTPLDVVYVVAEGGRGVYKRAAALVRQLGPSGGRFHLLVHPINLLDPEADLPGLVAAVNGLGVPAGLTVVDTLSRAMAGGDENASTDMGAMVRNLDALRNATAAHVMVVHHTGKDKAKGARGHSLLRAATDTEIEIADGAITVTKQRDLDKSFSSAFELDVVTLGADEDGDPITSCTVRLVARDTIPTDDEGKAMAALSEGEWRRDVQARDNWAGVAVANAFGLDLDDDVEKTRVKALLKVWIKSGKLREVRRKDAKRELRTYVEVVSADIWTDKLSGLSVFD